MNPRDFIAEVARMIGPAGVMPKWAKLPRDDKELAYLIACFSREPGRKYDGPYAEYLSSPEWRWRRMVVMVLARGLCWDCLGRADQVHHLTYKRRGRELLADLVPVCDKCHDGRHEKSIRSQIRPRRAGGAA